MLSNHQELDILIESLKPSDKSNQRRQEVCTFVEVVIRKLLPDGVRLVQTGSFPCRTYLPGSDIDLVLFINEQEGSRDDMGIEMSSVVKIFHALCMEVSSQDNSKVSSLSYVDKGIHANTIRNVEFINARTKLSHCVVNNLQIDITINQVGALSTVAFIEECNNFIGKNHLFKRSVLLLKAWSLHESPNFTGGELNINELLKGNLKTGPPILGSRQGMFSSYALSVLVLYLFNKFPKLDHPLGVLLAFFYTYAPGDVSSHSKSYTHEFPWGSNVLCVDSGLQSIGGGGGGSSGGQPTSFVVAPQPSGLKWCLGRLSFADDHNIDVKWNMTLDSFTLGLDLSNAHPQACGRVELPLFQGEVVEIEMDGAVVKKQSVSDEALQPRHVIDIPTPLRSHVFVVRRISSQ